MKYDHFVQDVTSVVQMHSAISPWRETCWFDSKNNAVGLYALNWIICDLLKWIEFQQGQRYSAWNYSADSQRSRKYLCNIYDRLMRGAARESIHQSRQKPLELYISAIFSDQHWPAYRIVVSSLTIGTANIPMAITRIMPTDFSSRMNADTSVQLRETRWLSFISQSDNQQAYFKLDKTDNYTGASLYKDLSRQ